MGPEAEHAPPGYSESAGDGNIALFVAAEFGEPAGAVTARIAAVLGAAMPETAVHEDGEVGAPEDKVGAAGEGAGACANR